MSFGQMVVTSKGALLSAKTLQGKVLKFDCVEIGSGELGQEENTVTREALIQKELECNIIDSKIINDKQVRLSFFFKNTDAEKSFYFREIGLFAIDPDTQENMLYAYTNAGTDAEYINHSLTISNAKTIDIDVLIDNASELTIELKEPTAFVTEENFEEFKQRVVEHNNEYTAKCKTLILEKKNWILNEETGYYEYPTEDENITENHYIEACMDIENQLKLSSSSVESYNGSFKIITTELPTEDITMNIVIQKVAKEEEGENE